IKHDHPFREGNTLTQFAIYRQLSLEAGYLFHTERFKGVAAERLRATPLVGDLREQFVWGRFEFMQTEETTLLRDVLDRAITVAPGARENDGFDVGPIVEFGVVREGLSAATPGHPRSVGSLLGRGSDSDHGRVETTAAGVTYDRDSGY
ncbi:cell filamentation protein Fic, partial [Rhodococcus sp. NPDC058514]